MKTVRTFGNLAEAGFASSLLEAAGIQALLADEQTFTIGYGAAIGGLRLQVDDADWDRAVQVLESGPDAATTIGKADELPSTPSEPGRIPTGLFLAAAAFFVVLAFAVYNAIQQKQTGARSSKQTEEYDYDHDGKPDHFFTYRNGRNVSATVDRNYDGRIDEWDTYNSEGVIARVELDDNFDGKPDAWITYKYAAPVMAKRDTDFNGLVDCIDTYENGIVVLSESAPNESSPVVRRYLYVNGVLREEWVDENRDGIFDYKILHDPFGATSGMIPIEAGK